MNLGLLIPVLGLAPLCLIALWQLPKMWRFKADIQRTEATKPWWPFGEALRHGFVRGMPVGILAGTALTVSMTLVLVEESTSGGTSGRWPRGHGSPSWSSSGWSWSICR